jgi:MFS family permease
MNSEAVAVERDLRRPVLSGFHGLASLGVGLGAISGSYLSVKAGLTATAVVSLLVHAAAICAVLLGTPDRGATHPRSAGSTWFRPTFGLVALSLVLGASMAGELAATMFSAQTLAGQAPALAAYAGAGATAFALFQAVMRLCGDRLRSLFGDERLVSVSLAVALLGFVVVAVSSGFGMSALGFAIVGLGTACIVPCGFATAARMSHRPAATVISMLSLITGLLRIPAPLAYGWLASRAGFAPSFLLYALIAGAALVLALVAFGRPNPWRSA